MRIWFNHGYSHTYEAVRLTRDVPSSKLQIYATHSRPEAPVLSIADHAYLEHDIDRSTTAGRQNYADWCCEFVSKHKIEIFVAQRGRTELSGRIKDFEALGCKLLVAADSHTLQTIENKTRFYEACQAWGLPIPVTIPVTNRAGFDDAVDVIKSMGHTVCIKPRFGVFGAGYFRLDNDTPLFEQLMAIDNRALNTHVIRDAIRKIGNIPEMLVMQHLPGTEWSVDCLCANGQIIAGFVRAKEGHSQRIDNNPLIMDLARKLVEKFQLSNIVNIQFKSATADNTDPRILEINPRMSGGCAYGALAGINLPMLQIMHAAGILRASDIPAVQTTIVASVGAAVSVGQTIKTITHA